MTQVEKELLLKDLCARLPYGVKIHIGKTQRIEVLNDINLRVGYVNNTYADIKPYLFPLSSITKEQRKEYEGIIYKNIELHCERYYDVIDIDDFDCLIDFYHKYHFDYRGLIPMGLAIDATNLNIY